MTVTKCILKRGAVLALLLGLYSCNVNPPTPPTIPAESGDLKAVVAAMIFSYAGTLDYVPPTDKEKTNFGGSLNSLLNGDEGAALSGFQNLNLKITKFTDTSSLVFYLIRETGPTPRGWGLYAVNPTTTRKIVIEAPHPIADQFTETEATFLFLNLNARALLIAGAHRCASQDFSSCSGTTNACANLGTEEPYRVSDAAHSEEQVFETANEEIMDTDGSLTAIALHGFDQQAGDPHAFVSNGTVNNAISTVSSNRFASLLIANSGVTNAAISCNNGTTARLCGTDDLQGRFVNGSADVCQDDATGSTQRYLHLEQSLDLRTDSGSGDPLTPTSVLNVLKQLF